MDFTKYFKKYEKIVALTENAFSKVKNEHVEYIRCKIGCSDCCHAVFDIGFIEALYINHHFHDKIGGVKKELEIEEANKADRLAYKLKKKAYKEVEKGKKEEVEVIAEMALERIKCPLLNSENMCDLYNYRPITCRLYGIPISIGNMSHTCGRSGFEEKKKYPTIKLEILQQKLYELSSEVVIDIKSKYSRMGEMLVPVSMALLTNYDEDFLGVKIKKDSKDE